MAVIRDGGMVVMRYYGISLLRLLVGYRRFTFPATRVKLAQRRSPDHDGIPVGTTTDLLISVCM